MSRRHPHHPDAGWPHREWRGYDPRAALPMALLATAVWLGLLIGWPFPNTPDFVDRVGAILYVGLSPVVWVLLVVGVAYRLVTYTYVLTDHALLVEFGSRNPPVPPIPFKDVTAVAHGADWFGRVLGVGWVRVTAGAREVTLLGVRRPAAFADAIRAAGR